MAIRGMRNKDQNIYELRSREFKVFGIDFLMIVHVN